MKIEHTANGILLSLEAVPLPDKLLDPIRERWYIEDDDEDFAEMIEKASRISNACAYLRAEQVTSVERDCVTLGDTSFVSALVAEKLCTPGMTAVGYVATCGQALYQARADYEGDSIAVFIWDQICENYLRMARDMLQTNVTEHYFPSVDNKKMFAHLSPGSLEAWPISAQKDLFAFLGDGVPLTGVKLTDSMLMLPIKSSSGIFFPTETPYENCMHCPRISCPGRRAPYAAEM